MEKMWVEETKPEQMLERKDEEANSVTSVGKDSVVVNEEAHLAQTQLS